jgi:hypothetical protein
MADSPFSKALSGLVSSVRNYILIHINLLKLELMEKSARIISLTIASFFLIMLMMLFLLFISLAAAMWIGQIVEHPALGYLIIAGFYLVVAIIFFTFRRKLFLGLVIKHLSEIFFENEKEDSDD